MANVSWSVPGTSDNWNITTNWTGLPVGESYPGQSIADDVTIGGSGIAISAYVVTFDVTSATVGSITIEGGFFDKNLTTLRMTAGNTLNIQAVTR